MRIKVEKMQYFEEGTKARGNKIIEQILQNDI